MIRAFVLGVVFQALLFGVWALYIVFKFRNNADTDVAQVRTYFTAFVLPMLALQLAVGSLALRFASRANATVRLLATLLGGLVVFEASFLRGIPGILLTLMALTLVGLALWPDKSAPERGTQPSPDQSPPS